MSLAGGNETRVNSYTTDMQEKPSVTALPGGGWVVTWGSYGQDGSGYGVYQQKFNAAGVATGSETRVNVTVTSSQYMASVAGLPSSDGGWVTVWESTGQDGSGTGIYQQRFDAGGTALSSVDILVNTHTTNHQTNPSVTVLTDGGWVVTWESWTQDGSGLGIYQQRYTSAGVATGGETRVNSTTLNGQDTPSVTALSGGGWVVTWNSADQDGTGINVYQQRYDLNGSPQGSETRVNTYTTDSQLKPSVTGLADGGWVVTWQSQGQNGNSHEIYQQRYDASGVAIGSESRVNATILQDQTVPSVTALSDGGWVVTWQSWIQDGNSGGIYQQHFDVNGNAYSGSDTRVNQTWSGSQEAPSVTALSDGGWVVTWQTAGQDGSGAAIYQRVYHEINDAPAGTDKTLTLSENASYVLSVGDFGYSDTNGDALLAVIISQLPSRGQLTLNGVPVVDDQSIAVADISAGKLVWQPPANDSGNNLAALKFILQDDGGSANGGDDTSVERTITFNVTSVSEAPSSAGSTVTILEDEAYVFGSADFPFYDSDGDALTGMVITTLPVKGTLTLGGTPVSAGQQITPEDVAGGKLVWTPGSNENGAGFASLNFKLIDSTGAGSPAYSISFNVTPVNDNPALSVDPLSTYENVVLTFDILAGASDVEGDALSIQSATIVAGFGKIVVENGKLVYDPTVGRNQNIDAGESKTVVVRCTVADSQGGQVTQDIAIEVKGVSPDLVRGTMQADNLTGSRGADILFGLRGDDVLDGRGGADRLHGGRGADTFLFTGTGEVDGRDVIRDYSRRQGDRIDLREIDANELVAGNQSFRFIGNEEFSGSAGELRYEARIDKVIVRADTNGDRKADFSLLIDSFERLFETDFLL